MVLLLVFWPFPQNHSAKNLNEKLRVYAPVYHIVERALYGENLLIDAASVVDDRKNIKSTINFD